MTSATTEDYLKTMYAVERTGGRATTSILAARLGVQPASVTGMIKRLASMELVSHTPYGAATLTEKGRLEALGVIRHHRLIERFLVDTLGVPWDEVHQEAHKLEHALSDPLADRIDAFLGHPDFCPHGSPIPTASGEIADPPQVPLADLSSGETAIISEVDDEDAALLRYLGELNLVPGARIQIIEVAPYDDTLTYLVSGQEHTVGAKVAASVWVRPLISDDPMNERSNERSKEHA